MSRNRDRDRRKTAKRPSELDAARNELFSHINRCGVIGSTEEQQTEWMKDTIEFLGERYPSLTDEELDQLEAIGLRFCRPVIAQAPAAAAEATADEADAEGELDAELEAELEHESAAA